MSDILKCDRCNNMALSPPANNGDLCGKSGCWGHFQFMASSISVPPKTVMLKCNKCGNIYKAGSTRRMFDECKVNGCSGRLDRY